MEDDLKKSRNILHLTQIQNLGLWDQAICYGNFKLRQPLMEDVHPRKTTSH
jgi:hypothetical protein